MRIDYRHIKKMTGCTEEQAIYLAREIRKFPKVNENIMSHISGGKVNLINCDEVKVCMLYNYMDDWINIVGYRPQGKFGLHYLHKYSFVENRMGYEVV